MGNKKSKSAEDYEQMGGTPGRKDAESCPFVVPARSEPERAPERIVTESCSCTIPAQSESEKEEIARIKKKYDNDWRESVRVREERERSLIIRGMSHRGASKMARDEELDRYIARINKCKAEIAECIRHHAGLTKWAPRTLFYREPDGERFAQTQV